MLLSLISLAATFCVGGVSAHGGVLAYSNDGNWYQGFKPYNTATGQTTIQRPWDTYNPIQDASSPMIACNDDGTSLASGQLTATVKAGSAVTAYWNQIWPHETGPVLVYLGQCPGSSCTGVNAATIKWFKIEHAGLLSGTIANGQWAAGKMISTNNSWTTTIPSTVPSGNYLLRFETIALHSQPAQFYPECAQIQITGGGNVPPSSSILVTFPGGYKSSDPGLTVDLYGQAAKTETTYVIPGPPLYNGAGAAPSTSTSAPPATTPLPPVTTTTTASAAPPVATATVPHYGQCGGSGWTGLTVCAAPYTCQATNQYYSQCV